MTRGRGSFARDHTDLVAYVGALMVVWVISVATWSVRASEPPQLHQFAVALQYLLVLLVGTVAAFRLRESPSDDSGGGAFRWDDREWRIADDVGGRAFWRAVAAGAVAMEVNVLLLVSADLLAARGAGGLGTYLGWLGTGLVLGALIGMLGAVVALVVSWMLGRRHPTAPRA